AGAESPRVPAWSPPPDRTMRVPDPVSPIGSRTGSTTSSHVRRRFRERRRSVIVAWVASMVAAALLAALIILLVHGARGTNEPRPSQRHRIPSLRLTHRHHLAHRLRLTHRLLPPLP